jgi:AcrR family transcriptional regulator
MTTTTGTAVPVGRPRSAEADLAITTATLELLASEGYGGLTMSGVAAAAGVSTATLYRRWRSKVELVVGVLLARAEEHPIPDTGSLAGDVRAFLRNVVRAAQARPGGGSMMAGLVGDISRNPELAHAFRTVLVAPRRAALVDMLDRAAARGELRAGIDYDVVADLLVGAIYNRLLVTGQPITVRVADKLADLVVRAVSR